MFSGLSYSFYVPERMWSWILVGYGLFHASGPCLKATICSVLLCPFLGRDGSLSNDIIIYFPQMPDYSKCLSNTVQLKWWTLINTMTLIILSSLDCPYVVWMILVTRRGKEVLAENLGLSCPISLENIVVEVRDSLFYYNVTLSCTTPGPDRKDFNLLCFADIATLVDLSYDDCSSL